MANAYFRVLQKDRKDKNINEYLHFDYLDGDGNRLVYFVGTDIDAQKVLGL